MDDDELLNDGEQIELTEEDLKELGSDIEDDEELKPYIRVKREEKKVKSSSGQTSSEPSSEPAKTRETTLPPNPQFFPTLLYVHLLKRFNQQI